MHNAGSGLVDSASSCCSRPSQRWVRMLSSEDLGRKLPAGVCLCLLAWSMPWIGRGRLVVSACSCWTPAPAPASRGGLLSPWEMISRKKGILARCGSLVLPRPSVCCSLCRWTNGKGARGRERQAWLPRRGLTTLGPFQNHGWARQCAPMGEMAVPRTGREGWRGRRSLGSQPRSPSSVPRRRQRTPPRRERMGVLGRSRAAVCGRDALKGGGEDPTAPRPLTKV